MTPQAPDQVKEPAGRVALVTGGAARVGRAIALRLARGGCDVAIGYRRSAAAARATVAAIHAAGVRGVAIRADIARPAEARRLVRETARRLGRLDVLVNNAAVFFPTPFARTTPAELDRFLAVNLKGAFFCAQEAARLMQRRGGRIINIADVGGARAWPSYVAYGVSKAGLLMLTRELAVALAPRIQVNAVGPGVVLLPEGTPPPARRRLARGVPAARQGEPGDVAEAVWFFATGPDFITGQILFVDGGVTAL
jgi:NAD(P)-dependent dehydrogenase (short-subunit alcohol dehydrogenase family)